MPETSNSASLLSTVLKQEQQFQFDSFDHGDAWILGNILRDLARKRSLSVAISVALGEQCVFHAGLPGASIDNEEWIDRKFRVVRRFELSSLAVRLQFEARGKDFDVDSRLDRSLYAAFGGAFPLRIQGRIVGIVGVSGLPHLEDHALVIEGLHAHPATAWGQDGVGLRPQG